MGRGKMKTMQSPLLSFCPGPFDITMVKFSTVQGVPKNIDK